MNDFEGFNSLNSNVNDENVNENENNGDSDNNIAQNLDNDVTATNTIHRNNFTARDHLFQAMFSRIALTYDRTFPPFARRFIEFMLLITALAVLFILIYIHLAFVKAPITCLDNYSFEELAGHDDSSLKHMVIRVEILSNPPLNYGLFNSYSKEYDDINAVTVFIKNSSSTFSSKNDLNQLTLFLNLIHKKCQKGMASSDTENKDHIESKGNSENKKATDNTDQNQTEGAFYKLFHFPINPIIEKAEYWREKLSVRAMAPFRQTFNDLELFAKSVFTEEKYIMEYSLEYGLLRLTPETRERLNIPVHFILLDATKDKCFGNALSRFILEEFVGYDQIIIGSLKRLAERQSGKGYVRNVVSGEHYRFVNSWMSRTSYLAAGFIMIIFTLSVSMLLRYSHHQIFVFIVDLLRMLENNLQFSFPAAPLLTVVLALVGMEAIMSEFFNDTSTAFYTILIIWLADQYEAVCCRTYVSKRHWPRYFYLYHFAFYAYHYRFNGQFSGLALLCSWLFIQHSMFFFFHHYELPRLMQGIAVRAIMDSLIVERAENTSLTPTPIYANEDDNNDLPGGDRRDNDEDPGSSNMPSLRSTNDTLVPRTGDYKPPNQPHNATSPSHPAEATNNASNRNNGSQSTSSIIHQSITKKRFTIKKSLQSPNFVVKTFNTLKTPNLDKWRMIQIVPNVTRDILSYRDEVIDGCIAENLFPMSLWHLSENLLDQVYSMIVIWVTMISLNDGLYRSEHFLRQDHAHRSATNEMLLSKKKTHYRVVDNEERTKSIIKRSNKNFTCARNINEFKYRLNQGSLKFRETWSSTKRLLFPEKEAIAMKLFHQVLLCVEGITKRLVTVHYNNGVNAVSHFAESVLGARLVDRICDKVTEEVLLGRMVQLLAAVRSGQDEDTVEWSRKKCYQSVVLCECRHLAHVHSACLQIRESAYRHATEGTLSHATVTTNKAEYVPMKFVQSVPCLTTEVSGSNHETGLHNPAIGQSVSVTVATESRDSSAIDVDTTFVRCPCCPQWPNVNGHQFCSDVTSQQDAALHCRHLSSIEMAHTNSEDSITTLSAHLHSYLDSIRDPVKPKRVSTIPLFDLFPEDY